MVNLRKAYQNNPLIGHISLNSLRKKIVGLREVLSRASIDILCVDETKLDVSFPDHQFKISGYHFSATRRDCSSKGVDRFCSRSFYCKTNQKI